MGEENQPDGGWLEDDPRVPWLIDILKAISNTIKCY